MLSVRSDKLAWRCSTWLGRRTCDQQVASLIPDHTLLAWYLDGCGLENHLGMQPVT